MSDYEVTLRTKVGNLTVHFDDAKDLESKLSSIQSYVDMIEKTKLVIPESIERKVMPGMEDIYVIESGGLPKLLKLPKKVRDVIRLTLFVSSRPLTVSEIKLVTGISNPLANMGSKDFVKLPDGTFTLGPEGKSDVSSNLIPSLKGD